MDFLQELTRIRNGRGEFFEKAVGYAEVLRTAGATDIVVMACDVCEEDLHPGHTEIFHKLCQELDPDTQMDEISRRLDGQTPRPAFTRVQAQTERGYHTFCFFCDATMCMNEVDYPDNPDWDKLQKARSLRYIRLHPEWEGRAIQMVGSTRHRVCFDLIIPAGAESDFHTGSFEGCVVQVNLTPEDDQLFQIEPKLKAMYAPLQS